VKNRVDRTTAAPYARVVVFFSPIIFAICIHFANKDMRHTILASWIVLLPLICIWLTAKRQILVSLESIVVSMVLAFLYSSDMGGEYAHGLLGGFLLLSAIISFPVVVLVALVDIWRNSK
jgi:hypothetical protein